MDIKIHIHIHHQGILPLVIHPDKNTNQIGKARNRTILHNLEKMLSATVVVVCKEKIKHEKVSSSLEMSSHIKIQHQSQLSVDGYTN